jgi:predicted RNase H-like HicB family nuclease
MPSRKSRVRKAGFPRNYTVFFIRDVEAGGYTVHIPAFGIVTEGEDLKEARAMARDAVEGRLAVLRELGQSIPKDMKTEQIEVAS